jgi:streptogramin lyase
VPTATLSPTPSVTLPVVEPVITTIGIVPPGMMAAGAGSVWVSSEAEGTVSRIDPATSTIIATIDVTPDGGGSSNAIAADDTAVWVVAGILNLVRIDPATNQIVSTTAIDQPIDRLVLGDGTVWLVSSDSNQVRRFDPATNTFSDPANIDRPQSATIADDIIWVVKDAGRGTDTELVKVDLATATVQGTVPLDGYFTYDLVYVGGSLWAPTDSALLQIDSQSGLIVATYPLPQPVRGVPTMTAGDGSIWVCKCSSEPGDALWQFDTDTREWSAEIPAGDLEWETWLAYVNRSILGYTDRFELLNITLPE